MTFVKNCIQWIPADRLTMLGGPLRFYAGFRLMILGGPFVFDLHTSDGPFGHSRRSALRTFELFLFFINFFDIRVLTSLNVYKLDKILIIHCILMHDMRVVRLDTTR